MNLEIRLAEAAEKFLEKNRISEEEIFKLVRMAVRKFQGENINLDIKKLKGAWSGFHRITTYAVERKTRIFRRSDVPNIAQF